MWLCIFCIYDALYDGSHMEQYSVWMILPNASQ